MSRSRLNRDGTLEAEDLTFDDVGSHAGEPGVTVWLDLSAPTPDELASVGEKLGLHELAVEGAASELQRTKLDRYDVAGNVLITVRKNDQLGIDAVLARWDGSPDLAKYSVAFLLHGLLDYVVDGHFVAVQALDDALESLEDTHFADTPGPDAPDDPGQPDEQHHYRPRGARR